MRGIDSKINILNPLEKGPGSYRKLTPYRVLNLTLTLRWLFPVLSFELILSSGQRSGREAIRTGVYWKPMKIVFSKLIDNKISLKLESQTGNCYPSLLLCGLL